MRAIILVWGLTCVLLNGCSVDKLSTLPEALHGKWVSSAPKYRDSEMQMTATSISFTTGRDHHDKNIVDRVEESMESDGQLYVIHYHSPGDSTAYSLSFYHLPDAKGGKIRFRYQDKITWSKLVSPQD